LIQRGRPVFGALGAADFVGDFHWLRLVLNNNPGRGQSKFDKALTQHTDSATATLNRPDVAPISISVNRAADIHSSASQKR
jgi:hypothetical protein